MMTGSQDLLYEEKITSNRTLALFLALAATFLLLHVWRVSARGLDLLAGALLILCAVFLFYSVNYRTLVIQLTSAELRLTFGLFTWKVPLDNIEAARLDDIPTFKRLGGAGIHFMYVRKRYRASFNFLEYPRVVLAFKRKVGPVHDISFTTHQPDELLRLLGDALTS
jgi:hypothetical protein